MTDFNAGNPGSTPQGATNFQQGGGANSGTPDTADTAVILEINGRKFTKADLVTKITHADNHINTLNTELSEQRKLLDEVNETLKKQVTAAELLNQMKQGQQNVQAPAVVPEAAKPVTAEEVARQVLGKIAEGETAKQREANLDSVRAVLTQVYGDAVNTKVQQVAAEAGLTVEQAAELARSNPKVFLKLFPDAAVKAKPSALPNSGNVNPQSFQSQQQGPSGWHKANGAKQATTIYMNRLKELGL